MTAAETPEPAERGKTTIAALTAKLARMSREIESGSFSSENLQRDQEVLLTQRESGAYRDGIHAALSAYSNRIGSLTAEESDTNVEERVGQSIETVRFKIYKEFAGSDRALEEQLLRLFMHGVEVVQAHWNSAGKDILLANLRQQLQQRSRCATDSPREAPSSPSTSPTREQQPPPESAPSLALNEAYFLGGGNIKRIGDDLNAFDSREEGRENRWKELKATGKDKVEPGTRARISTGQEMLWKDYLRTASDILAAAGYAVKTETGRFSSSRTLKILKGIADGTIKGPTPTPHDETPEPPPPDPTPAPHPEPHPLEEGTEPEPTPEAAPEKADLSRYLEAILQSTEREAFLERLKGPNGRLWIDKKVGDRTVRIWLSLDLTPEDMAKPPKELYELMETRLQSMSLKVRVDDPTKGESWKEKWGAKKAGLQGLVTKVTTASDAEKPTACTALAESLFGTEATHAENRKTFVTLLQQYLTRPDGKSDIWTHIRNAYWHSGSWEEDLTKVSRDLGASFTLPQYKEAKVKTWEKMDARTSALLAPTGRYTVRIQGKNGAEYVLAERREKDGKISYHFADLGWIRESDLRICEKKEKQPDGSWKPIHPATFELLAWQVQTTPPTEGVATTPPPEPKGPATPLSPSDTGPKGSPAAPASGPKPSPKAPPAPVAGKKTGADAMPPGDGAKTPPPVGKGPDGKAPAAPKLVPAPAPAPKESHEAAEVLRKQEIIAIPDIHGDADALFASLQEAGYVKGSRAGKWELDPRAKTGRIILTGDLLDRGPQNLATLDLILELQKRGANIEILGGNHDLFIPEALGEELPELGKPAAKIDALTEWIGDEDAQVLQEVCNTYCAKDPDLPQKIDLCKRAHIAAYYALENGDDPDAYATFRTILANPIFQKVLRKAEEVFLAEKTPYKPIFDTLKIMTAADDVLYVHAGINDQWIQLMLDATTGETNLQKRREKAVQAANNHFKTLMKKPSSLTRTSWKDIIWMRNFSKKLSTKVADGLKQLGFRMVVHGHDRDFHAQEVQEKNDIKIVNGDVSMSAGYRGSRKAFLRIGKDGVGDTRNGAKANPALFKLPTRKK